MGAALESVHFHSLRIAEIRHDTRDALVVGFDIPDALAERFRYVQGQHLTLRTVVDGEEMRRSYSICTAVQDGALRIAIKRVAGGVFSEWAHTHLATGTMIDVMPPEGRFHVPLSPDNARHVLAFAAGSGITPILSIAKTMLLAEPRSHFTLVYGNRASSTVMFREELAELKDRTLDRFNLVHVLSREHQDVELFNGRITGEKCDALLSQWIALDDVDVAFICGPEEMTRSVVASLEAHGLHGDRIKTELFAAGSPLERRPRALSASADAKARTCEVTLVLDGVERRFSMPREDESLLDAALAAGIDVRHSCKGGVCATCRCKVIEGEVDMDANYALEDYEIARGFVLSCQSFPAGEKLVVDFDRDD